jgi:hypothetical protein
MLKISEMDFGTKLRTLLAIVTSLNTALIATDLTGFENPTVDFWYKIISIILNFVIVAITTYFNQSYTQEGQVGTYATRVMKVDPAVVVDVYDPDEDDDDNDDEEEDDGEVDEVIDDEVE